MCDHRGSTADEIETVKRGFDAWANPSSPASRPGLHQAIVARGIEGTPPTLAETRLGSAGPVTMLISLACLCYLRFLL
jgi:hypothetical protein